MSVVATKALALVENVVLTLRASSASAPPRLMEPLGRTRISSCCNRNSSASPSRTQVPLVLRSTGTKSPRSYRPGEAGYHGVHELLRRDADDRPHARRIGPFVSRLAPAGNDTPATFPRQRIPEYANGPGSSTVTVPSASTTRPRVSVSAWRPEPLGRMAKI